jgi:hypothetical protein
MALQFAVAPLRLFNELLAEMPARDPKKLHEHIRATKAKFSVGDLKDEQQEKTFAVRKQRVLEVQHAKHSAKVEIDVLNRVVAVNQGSRVATTVLTTGNPAIYHQSRSCDHVQDRGSWIPR